MIQLLKKIPNLEQYALWVFMFLLVFDFHFMEDNWLEAIKYTGIEVAFYMAVFYFNYLWIIPSYLAKKRLSDYLFLLTLGLLVYLGVIKLSGMEIALYDSFDWRNLMSMIINFCLPWLISTLYWYYQKLQRERELQLELKADKLETEIKFLKNQMSPHFIFNTLNNIYSLVQQGHKNAAPMLAKLSTILRYILYDSAQETVLLKKEMAAIQEYIELQLFRKPKSQNIDFYKEGNLTNLKIAPLLLLNFVENCFKHSNIELSEDAWIKVSCIVKENKQLLFTTENSKAISFSKKVQKEGIGNQNVKRQLELNYPNAHELNTTETADVFKTHLTIQLD